MGNNVTLKIEGMTCGHCVTSVTKELTTVPGVSNVEVFLLAGGTSTATLNASTPLENAVLEAAVTDAGFTLVSVDA
ncbi:heavy-metal-associated domain-containing protein [Arthrobacter sp. AQ5-05]|uniref:heavy-metal-associated domain-containing protein n=1 Tax=Arthrobacter sp. AQ5-05 TaxID=2184581 RepID=UPI00256FE957|nr:heavy-metal-associated domain-containing protein [Arthrobacter sp. AQ5-05]